jgi:hypothetical protein
VFFICYVTVIIRPESYAFLRLQLCIHVHYKTERLRMYAAHCTDAINNRSYVDIEKQDAATASKNSETWNEDILIEYSNQTKLLDYVCGSSD